MLGREKYYAGVTFLLQAASFLGMYVMLFRKRRALAILFLALGALVSVTGTALLWLDSKDERKRRKIIAARDACCAGDFGDEIIAEEE